MIFLYNLGIRFYYFLIRIASPFNAKAKNFLAGRKGLFIALKNALIQNTSPIAWFHAASLGEFEQGLPVMEAYRKAFPSHKILVTFFSPSGYEQRKQHPIADFIFYLPIDTRSHAKRFFDVVNPTKVFFIKYEYWFYYLNEAHQRSIPLYSISATFTANHIFFKPYGSFHRKMLGLFNHTFVQNESSLELLKSIGIEATSISGDTRFDRVIKTIAKPENYPSIEKFKGNDQLMIIGSAWPSDMQVLREFINTSANGLKFIIAPHMIDEASVRKVTKGLTKPFHRYASNEIIPATTEVLILDTMNMLSSVYQYGNFAYIGGAFGDGLHNILEAVAFGLPVVFGNKGLEKFPESIELQKLGGAFSVASMAKASEILEKLYRDNTFRSKTSHICKQYIQEHAGATEHIIDYLKNE